MLHQALWLLSLQYVSIVEFQCLHKFDLDVQAAGEMFTPTTVSSLPVITTIVLIIKKRISADIDDIDN